MKVVNVHKRKLETNPIKVSELLDSLASNEDRLWPKRTWPPMKLDRRLEIGASGGHGPIRYIVEKYLPGEVVQFRFTAPRGFEGFHQFEIVDKGEGGVLLRHVLQMRAEGWANFTWPIIFRPLHDACIEDALATAEASLGFTPKIVKWKLWVRFLRWILSRGRARSQDYLVSTSC